MSHLFLNKMDFITYEAYCELIKSGLLRFSVNKTKVDERSYYWTYLGNAVLFSLDIISEEILLKRVKEYHDHEKNGRFLVVKNELSFQIPELNKNE
ncbi:MAG TPA: hypothetical protein ENL20_09675 [Candidatus Cloacimonetes bacterium]|nr:hypothetical protein [Candidatus Cloacimonadota bacterium]